MVHLGPPGWTPAPHGEGAVGAKAAGPSEDAERGGWGALPAVRGPWAGGTPCRDTHQGSASPPSAAATPWAPTAQPSGFCSRANGP